MCETRRLVTPLPAGQPALPGAAAAAPRRHFSDEINACKLHRLELKFAMERRRSPASTLAATGAGAATSMSPRLLFCVRDNKTVSGSRYFELIATCNS